MCYVRCVRESIGLTCLVFIRARQAGHMLISRIKAFTASEKHEIQH